MRPKSLLLWRCKCLLPRGRTVLFLFSGMHPFAICVVTVIIVFTVGDESGADEIVGGADGAAACKSGLHDDTGVYVFFGILL